MSIQILNLYKKKHSLPLHVIATLHTFLEYDLYLKANPMRIGKQSTTAEIAEITNTNIIFQDFPATEKYTVYYGWRL